MSELFLTRTGPPAEVVHIRPMERPYPGPGEVRVRMHAAAINPADLNFIEGTYGKKPELPCVPGMEGAGVIEELGEGVADRFPELAPGTPVLPVRSLGNWSTWRVLAAFEVVPLPAVTDLQQAALLRINPATAWGLLHAAGPPAAGTWVAQNAASSAAGHCVIQIARSLGLKTLNFVRRSESIRVCQDLGADLVFLDDPDGLAAAKAAMAAAGAPAPALALNAVGGDSALRLLDLLGINGTHITYGAMARQALKVPNGLLIFKTLVLRGFWLTRWQNSLPPQDLVRLYQTLAGLAAGGGLRQQIAATYPIHEYRAALGHAAQNARNGKILLTF
jgi:trans-2-enoyl-CoA reductase